ncbi:MAG: hypothetical protein ACPGUV_09700 [Polyangiales bacterium]
MLSLACALFWLVPAGLSAADKGVKGEVIVIVASEKPGKIDPSLRSLGALKRPPLNAYRSMKVESRRAVRLQVKKAEKVQLPNGRTLKLVIDKVNANGSFQVSASLKTPKRDKYAMLLRVTAAPGDPFFVAGQRHGDGTLIIGVTLGAR